jgi:hypothetical protein
VRTPDPVERTLSKLHEVLAALDLGALDLTQREPQRKQCANRVPSIFGSLVEEKGASWVVSGNPKMTAPDFPMNR